jgi:hypothetical protein
MPLRDALEFVAQAPGPESLEDFRRHIDPAWIHAALESTGTASIRRRRLPAEQVIWLVLGMALFRNRSIVHVADSLDLALPSRNGDPTAAASAISQARSRLGDEPLQWLFRTCADNWAHASANRHRWRQLAVYGVDGTSLRVPDSDENREHFGLPTGGSRGAAGYPQLRLVCLAALRSHLIVAAAFGPCSNGENTYAANLWSEVPNRSVCILDRNFLSANLLLSLEQQGDASHWLIRAKKNTKWEEVERFGEGDFLVRMEVSRAARAKNADLPTHWMARAIRYQIPGFRVQWLLTSLRDSSAYPAHEVAALYHERWEIEMCYDEVKTDILEREEAIRSRSPNRVRQELWGVLIAFNLVRLEMERIADEAEVEPTRISFVAAHRFICDEWMWCATAAPGSIPRHLKNLRATLKRFILPKRRSERKYPRAVKIKMSSYPRKRRSPREGGAK